MRTATAIGLAFNGCSLYGGLSVHRGAAECGVHVMQLHGGLSMHMGAAVRSEANVSSYDGTKLVRTSTSGENIY